MQGASVVSFPGCPLHEGPEMGGVAFFSNSGLYITGNGHPLVRAKSRPEFLEWSQEMGGHAKILFYVFPL